MKKTIEQKFVKQSLKDHILHSTDTYIGSIDKSTDIRYVLEDEKMVKKTITFIPGLYKIYDEIIVNAEDQWVRLKDSNDKNVHKIKNIYINIDKDSGITSVKNDGNGIEVEIHKDHNTYVPSLIFGELLTSSNYDKNEKKITGGKNGYGAKLTNIFSSVFTVETVDHYSKKKFVQTFKNNMSNNDTPIIKKCNSKPYTKITYVPDFKKFNIKEYNDDMIALMKKRAYDIAAWTDNKVNVFFNGNKIQIKSFEKYVDLYIGNKTETPRVYEKCNERWEIAAALNGEQIFQQISFVNGIDTCRGGKHVDHVINQITKRIASFILKKKKVKVKTNYIKENIIVFVKAQIENPSFDSQTKETLTTPMSKFGSRCKISDKFIETLAKSGVMQRAINLNQFKESNDLKKTDGSKKSRIRGIPKLDDANWAGTSKSNQCTLILTEGDSAKAMAMGGLGVLGRNKWGVYPLKGKILNVRSSKKTQTLLNNKEINDLKKIIGLESHKKYTNTNDLRYGKIMILTDQDEDGSHIKGLFFNLIETLWKELFSIDGFLVSMLTPIVKVTKGKTIHSFYSLPDYEKWSSENNSGKGWTIKYYKGLGTSTPKEAKEYFKDMKMVTYKNEDTSCEYLDLAFNKARANDRKQWLQTYNHETVLDYENLDVTYSDFINKDLIHFSNSDNIRSLPSVFDGLKPSQRKVMFCAFKRNLTTKEIRVAQLAGYVSEHGAYHHGEASLHGTIINLAQDFVGSNNINLLEPIGQFGTRLQGGKDSAQPRYIHTKLTKLSQILYNKSDNPLYKYLSDDGLSIEPIYYMPILPLILINGCQGIGTGWSTEIPCFNPVDIVNNIRRKMLGNKMIDMIPWYRGFKGTITKINEDGIEKYIAKGIYKVINNKVEITELPVKQSNRLSWTDDYKAFLETIIIDTRKATKTKKQYITNYKTYCSDTNVKFVLTFPKPVLEKLLKHDNNGIPKLETVLKLRSKINITNMNLYDKNHSIRHYSNVNEILEYYYDERVIYYVKRKDYIINELKRSLELLNSKIRFILEFISEKLKISNVSKQNLIVQLNKRKYPKLGVDDNFDCYEYLIKMPIYNLTKDKIDEFTKETNNTKAKINILVNKQPTELWWEDINEFIKLYTKLYL